MEEMSSDDELESMLKLRPSHLIERQDCISKLPDSLVSQILSYLPTKEVVSTSLLSKRWKKVWLLVPALDLDANDFPNHTSFASFMDMFLNFSREEKSCLHKLKLSVRKDVNDPPCVTRWLDFIATRKLKQLDVECHVNRKFVEVIPLSLYVCETLVYLRLYRVSLSKFESVSLPCVKTMSLEHNVYANDAVLETLISSCPVLEDLNMVRMVEDNVKVLRVVSKSLTSLTVELSLGEGDDINDDDGEFEKEGRGVFIDAPRLEHLKFQDDLSDSKIITNSGSLERVDLVYVFNEYDSAHEVDLPKRNMVRNFFTSISRVKYMKISDYTLEFFHYNLEYDPLPQFCNLSRLKVTFSLLNLYMLPTILESCPNLKSLVLVMDFDPFDEREKLILSFVPRCLMYSLEVVEIKKFNGGATKMEVAKYFVENSAVLEKLVLRLSCSGLDAGFFLLKDLLELPRRSSTCRVIVC